MKVSALSIASVGAIVALHAAPANAQLVRRNLAKTSVSTSSPTSDALGSKSSKGVLGIEPKPVLDKACRKFVGLWEGQDVPQKDGIPVAGADASTVKLNFRCKNIKDCSTVTLVITDDAIVGCEGPSGPGSVGPGFVSNEYECDDGKLKATAEKGSIICGYGDKTIPFGWDLIEIMEDKSLFAKFGEVSYGPHWQISNNQK